MLRDQKTTVSILALLASLFSAAPVCAQTTSASSGDGQGTQVAQNTQVGQNTETGTVETITVTGSRVISDIANSPTLP